MTIVEFVNYGDTIADVAKTEKNSASLTATTSILLAVLLIASFLSNLMLVATILTSYKLRACLLYLMLCQLGILNVLDTILVMFISLLYVSNGSWTFGDFVCRLNTWAQEFIGLYSFFIITLMATERALGLTDHGRHLVSGKYALIFSLVFFTVALCFATPAFLSNFSVHPYPYRYLCAIGGQSPIAYSIVHMIAYGGCIFVNTICFGALIRYNKIDRSLPARPQDYGAFIMESRALQDYMARGRLVLLICLTFIFVQGPYTILNFFMQIRNRGESSQTAQETQLAQDIDTLITWIKFFFPLIVSILVYTNCSDIWIKLVNLICCRRSNGIWASNKSNNVQYNNQNRSANNNVLTLVATTDGLRIRVPNGQFINPPPIHQYDQNDEESPIPSQRYESEMTTHNVIDPIVLKSHRGVQRSKIPRTKRSNPAVRFEGRLKKPNPSRVNR